MKKLLSLGLAVALVLTSTAAFAHPAVRIEITYDAATKTVSAVIHHPVANRTDHFIHKVDVDVNGKEIIEEKYNFQTTDAVHEVSFELKDVKPGDVVGIEAYCNKGGTLRVATEIK